MVCSPLQKVLTQLWGGKEGAEGATAGAQDIEAHPMPSSVIVCTEREAGNKQRSRSV